jgi:hypothetical protein
VLKIEPMDAGEAGGAVAQAPARETPEELASGAASVNEGQPMEIRGAASSVAGSDVVASSSNAQADSAGQAEEGAPNGASAGRNVTLGEAEPVNSQVSGASSSEETSRVGAAEVEKPGSAPTPAPASAAAHSAPSDAVASSDFRQSAMEGDVPSSSAASAGTAAPQAPPTDFRQAMGTQQAETNPVEERSALLEERSGAASFREGADLAPGSSGGGEGVSLEGVELAEASPEALEQATIEAVEAPAEPIVANTIGQGINFPRGAAKARASVVGPKGPPVPLHFSAATVALAAKNAPSPDDVPVFGSDVERQ